MEEGRDIRKDLELSPGDYAHVGVKSVVSLIPIIGGSAAELFSLVVSPPLEKRRDAWLIDIYDLLVSLKEKIDGFNIEDLSENENFISMLLYATQIAMRTHQKEKLAALKNAVVNSIFVPDIDESLQLIFLNIVDMSTPWHLIILKFLNDPQKFGEEHGTEYSNFISVPHSHILESAYPELKGRSEFYDHIVRDLYNNGLIKSESIQTTIYAVKVVSDATKMGKDFLRFIASDLE